MSVNVKSGSSTWSSFTPYAKTGSSTWSEVQNIYVKSGSSTWTQVYGVANVRPTAAVDTTTSGTYSFSNPSLTYDNSLGDTSTSGYSSAVTGQTIGQDVNCSPVVDGSPGDGYTIFSFDPGYSFPQTQAIINIKYKKSPSISGDNVFGASAFASISYSTDATNNTGPGTYNSLVGCFSSDTPDATFQTIQTTVTGSLNRQNFKIKVSAYEGLFVEITGIGDCNTPPPYDQATHSAAFVISDIYVTFKG